MKCICEWPDRCGGRGNVYCYGCGGDFCLCVCGGESECFGCADCERDYEDCEDGADEEPVP